MVCIHDAPFVHHDGGVERRAGRAVFSFSPCRRSRSDYWFGLFLCPKTLPPRVPLHTMSFSPLSRLLQVCCNRRVFSAVEIWNFGLSMCLFFTDFFREVRRWKCPHTFLYCRVQAGVLSPPHPFSFLLPLLFRPPTPT